jgi:signal recognition particle GTPase
MAMSRRIEFDLQSLHSGVFTIDDLRRLLAEGLHLWPHNEEVTKVRRLCGIIDAMTAAERRRPSMVSAHSRRLRVAIGAGVAPSEVCELIRQFDGMAKVIRQMGAWHRVDR